MCKKCKALAKVNRTKIKLKLYHDQILELINSHEGKTLIGKLVKSRQGIRNAFIKKAEDLLYKMIDLDENSPYVDSARKKLYSKRVTEQNNSSDDVEK